jgi:hypothetical protein
LGRILPPAGVHPRTSITALTLKPEFDFIIFRHKKTWKNMGKYGELPNSGKVNGCVH